jgi:acyl-coenzyme A thioesterase PaaI-like protein
MERDISGKNLFTDDRYCICCGEKNPLGFKMKFRFEKEKILSETVVPKEYQGFTDVVHGGILGTLLDELIVNLYWLKGEKVVTAEYQIRLKAPCPVNQKIFLSAWAVEAKRRLHYTAAEARLADGTLVAEATAKCLEIK